MGRKAAALPGFRSTSRQLTLDGKRRGMDPIERLKAEIHQRGPIRPKAGDLVRLSNWRMQHADDEAPAADKWTAKVLTSAGNGGYYVKREYDSAVVLMQVNELSYVDK